MLKLVRTTHRFISSQRYSGINLYVSSNLVDPRIHQRFISVFNGAISQTSPPFPSFSPLFCSPPFSRPLALSSFFLALRLFCWFWGLENEACHYMMSTVSKKPVPAVSVKFETTLKRMEVTGSSFENNYRNIALMSVSLLYRWKHLLTNETYSITHTKIDAPHHIHSCTCFVCFKNHNLKEILTGSRRETVSTVPFLFLCFSKSV